MSASTKTPTIQNPTKLYLLEQFDQWFSKDSRTTLGVFSSKEKALATLGYNNENWKKNKYYENGTNQWVSDALEEGIMIVEVTLDELSTLTL